MDRLLRKFETAKSWVPKPIEHKSGAITKVGAIYYGSTSPAMREAGDLLAADGMAIDLMRVRGFPFHQDVVDFINAHDQIFIVEQNRDAQLRTLVVNECNIDPAKLVPVLHYDGTPITAAAISEGIAMRLRPPVQQAVA
jgi:2-oxoglutarate ferredoxin oxidoreductase subunit alpha